MLGTLRHWVATVGLGPLLYAQGRRVRRTVVKLPEPPGPRQGVLGVGPPLRVLFVGDSSAVGVGAASLEEALPGQVVHGMAPTHQVSWRLIGRTGATTRETIARLRETGEAGLFDFAVSALGVNDMTSGRNISAWLDDQRELVELLQARFAVRHCFLSGLPPVHRFPALPQPLRWYLGSRARQFDRALQDLVHGQPSSSFVPVPGEAAGLDVDEMAVDGFHPGPRIYARWAEVAVLAMGRELKRGRIVDADPS